MNFFEHQAQARRKSSWMIILFVLAVIGTVLFVDMLFLLIGFSNIRVLALLSVLTILVIAGGSFYRISTLRSGGAVIAVQMGGIEVPEGVTDYSLRRFRNVAEEMAIASGVPVPRIFLLEQEQGINAFAAGYSTSDAAVVVTRGALDKLNRDELQGVVAHEFSHILNGDMRLNIRLMGAIFGIMMLMIGGKKILSSRGVSKGYIVGILLVVAGYVGVFFGRLIKAGASRQRELLADASAVQFTRQTDGLVGALKKMGGLDEGSRLNNRAGAEEVSHMLFGDGTGFSRWFATHPPLLERIQKLEPTFTKRQLDYLQGRWKTAPPSGYQEDIALGWAEVSSNQEVVSKAVALPLASGTINLLPKDVVEQVAHPGEDDYQQAHTLVESISPRLQILARESEMAIPLLLGLVLDTDSLVASKQLIMIKNHLGEEGINLTKNLQQQYLVSLHPSLRLPLVFMIFPGLRKQALVKLTTFAEALNVMIHVDGKVSLFEYCLSQLIQVQLREALEPARYAHIGRAKLGKAREAFAVLLAVVAQAGHLDDPANAQRAYIKGMQHVLSRDQQFISYEPPSDGVMALDKVWKPLDALDPLNKQLLVEAITIAIGHDGRVTISEAELLRTICAVLHCPLPPMLESFKG